MGDIVSLVEKAQDFYDEKQARILSKKIAKSQFGFDDFLDQIKKIKQMGNLKEMVNMIPGANKAMGDTEIEDDSFKHIEALIYSMTPKERSNPKIIDVNRKKRISKGSGLDIKELNKLLKQFEQMSKMMKMMQAGGSNKLTQMMQGMK